jgi:hypothetical protein
VLPSEVTGLDDFRGFLKYDPYIETLEEWGRVVEASEYIPVEHLGTTDDSRFLPFSEDTSTNHDTAFAKSGRT